MELVTVDTEGYEKVELSQKLCKASFLDENVYLEDPGVGIKTFFYLM